jgi:hypothetical protein
MENKSQDPRDSGNYFEKGFISTPPPPAPEVTPNTGYIPTAVPPVQSIPPSTPSTPGEEP